MIRDPDTMQYEYKYLLLDVKGTPYASPYSAAVADEATSRSSQTLSEEYRRDPKEEEEARTASIWSRVAMSCLASLKGKEPCRATSSARCSGLRNAAGVYLPRLLAKRHQQPRIALGRVWRARIGCVRKCNDWGSTHALLPTTHEVSQGHSARSINGMATCDEYSKRGGATLGTTANVKFSGRSLSGNVDKGRSSPVGPKHVSQSLQASWRRGRRGVQSKLRWIIRQEAVSWRRATALCPSLHNSEYMP